MKAIANRGQNGARDQELDLRTPVGQCCRDRRGRRRPQLGIGSTRPPNRAGLIVNGTAHTQSLMAALGQPLYLSAERF